MYESMRKRKGHWESFDDIDGLSHECWCVLEDKNGNIWIGTRNGLSRFDGREFVNLSERDGLANIDVQCLHRDQAGSIWIGTRNGLSRYDEKGFTNFTDKDGLIHNFVQCLHEDSQGNIWIGTLIGLSRYDNGEFINFSQKDGLISSNIHYIHQDMDRNIWIGTSGGLSRYDGMEFVNFTAKDGLASNYICCILQDRDGNIWIGTNNGLSMYNGTEFINFTEQDGLAHNYVRCIHQDRSGNIWIGTLGGGVSCYENGEFVNFNIEHGLAHNYVFDIIQDREGSIWFACHHGGISRYEPYGISYISDDSVSEAIMRDSAGNLWWGAENVLSRFDGKNTEHYHLEHGIYDLFEDSKGRFWIGTDYGGIFRYDSVKDIKEQKPQNLTVRDGLINNWAVRIREDSQGNIWIGSSGGVCSYDGVKITKFTTADGLGSNLISMIFPDSKGMLWFAGWEGGGVTRYDGKTFHTYTKDDGLADNRVICMAEDGEGNLWIGTSAGISCYDGEAFRTYTTSDGLCGNFIQRMLRDSRGQIWIATLGGGISRFDGSNFQVLTAENGLPSNNVTGIIEEPEGGVIISTYKGICKYTPGQESPPLIRIDEVDADRIYTEPDKIMLSEGASSLRIRYHGISFKTKWVRYNYNLAGYDEKWKATWGEEVRYENLPLGEYTFRVVAVDRDLTYSEKPAVLRLEVIADARDQVISELEEKVRERTAELRKHRDHLEDLVEERTRKLRESEEMYRTIFENTGTAAIMVEENNIISLANTEFEKLSGYSREELEGKETWTKFPTKESLERLEEYSRRRMIDPSDAPRSYEAQFVNSRGEIRDCLLTVSVIAGTRKRVVFVVDITEHKEETERIQAAKMEALRQLVAGVVHQMNSPIGAIISNNDISNRAVNIVRKVITEEYSQDIDEHKQLIKALAVLEKSNQVGRTAADSMAKIVTNLRHFVKLDEAEWQFSDIHEGLDNVIALMGPEFLNRIEVTKNYGDIPRIYCSPSSLNQVFMSLLKNASEAIVEKGEIRIRTSDQGEYIRIEIGDTGRGIPAEKMDRIFEPSFTTKGVKVGVGLGLSICYKIVVNEHRGHIDVSSEPGRGTTFTITLPKHSDRIA